jgi:peptidoglycan/LPS O-acetylase OafA/YrhL
MIFHVQYQSTTMPIETDPQTIQISETRLKTPALASLPKARRIPGLDFTKGALVLLMVLYHWINYFIGIQWEYYRYLRFLTPSFIFITGFMISHVYLSKYAASDSRLWKRLLTRGLKLMIIFLVLNVARIVVVPVLGTGVAMQNLSFLGNLFGIFISGNLPIVGTKIVSFSILVPISYSLMLSGVLMLAFSRFRYTFHIASLFLLLSIALLTAFGTGSYNLEFVTIGMIGVVAGFAPLGMLNDFVRHPYVLAFAYMCYVIAITIWNVPFLLLIVGVFLNLCIMYLIGSGRSEPGLVRNEVILLGKYSLWGYISQVAILQILSAGSNRMNLEFAKLPLSFFVAFVLTIASVETVDRARASFASVDRLYKAIFA